MIVLILSIVLTLFLTFGLLQAALKAYALSTVTMAAVLVAALPGGIALMFIAERVYVGVLNLHRGLAFFYFMLVFISMIIVTTQAALALWDHAPEAVYLTINVVILLLIFVLYNIFVCVQLLGVVGIKSPSERILLSAEQPSLFRGEGLARLFGIPNGIDRYRGNTLLSLSPLVISSICFAIVPFLVYFLVFNMLPVYIEQLTIGASAANDDEARKHFVVFAVVAPVTITAFVALGVFLRNYAFRKLTEINIQSVTSRDARRPLLFLRPFSDDQVSLPETTRSVVSRILNFGRPIQNFDMLLVEEGTPLGPVIAIGNPNDGKNMPVGAQRQYVEHAEWKRIAFEHMNNAIAIVMVIDDSAGLWDEVEEILSRGHAHKTLFMLHPSYQTPEQQHLIIKLISDRAQRLGLGQLRELEDLRSRPEARRRRVLGFFVGRSGQLRVFQSKEYSWVSALLALRMFLRSSRFEG